LHRDSSNFSGKGDLHARRKLFGKDVSRRARKKKCFWRARLVPHTAASLNFDGRGCFDPTGAIARACGGDDQTSRFVAQQDVDATFSRAFQTLEANSEGGALAFASDRSCTAAARQQEVQDERMALPAGGNA
jgi:hypothetical protein